jgi:hypothetical protein
VYIWLGSVGIYCDSQSLTRRCGLSLILAAPSLLFDELEGTLGGRDTTYLLPYTNEVLRMENFLSCATWIASSLASLYRSPSKQASIHFCYAYQLILGYYYDVSALIIHNVFRAVGTVYSMDTHDSASVLYFYVWYYLSAKWEAYKVFLIYYVALGTHHISDGRTSSVDKAQRNKMLQHWKSLKCRCGLRGQVMVVCCTMLIKLDVLFTNRSTTVLAH